MDMAFLKKTEHTHQRNSILSDTLNIAEVEKRHQFVLFRPLSH